MSIDEGEEIEEAWVLEVERRIAEVEGGSVQGISLDQALAQVRSALLGGKSECGPRAAPWPISSAQPN